MIIENKKLYESVECMNNESENYIFIEYVNEDVYSFYIDTFGENWCKYQHVINGLELFFNNYFEYKGINNDKNFIDYLKYSIDNSDLFDEMDEYKFKILNKKTILIEKNTIITVSSYLYFENRYKVYISGAKFFIIDMDTANKYLYLID